MGARSIGRFPFVNQSFSAFIRREMAFLMKSKVRKSVGISERMDALRPAGLPQTDG
jgi:hypothetical protein